VRVSFRSLILRGVIDRAKLPHPLTRAQAEAMQRRADEWDREFEERKKKEIPF
jgi:hypothetical protein